jgi:hypothetical protein
MSSQNRSASAWRSPVAGQHRHGAAGQ